MEIDSSTATFVVGILITNLAAVVIGIGSILQRIAKLEVKADTSSRDIDNIARLIGTERSRNQKESS